MLRGDARLIVDRREPAQDEPAPTPLLALAAALALGSAIGAVSRFLLVKDLWVWEMPDLAVMRNDARATQLLLAMVIARCAVAVAGLALHAADSPGVGDRDAFYIAALTAVGALAAAALARGPRAA